jgi:hypothetical protein
LHPSTATCTLIVCTPITPVFNLPYCISFCHYGLFIASLPLSYRRPR